MGKMEINGRPVKDLLAYLKRDVAWLETVMGSGQLSANKLNLLKGLLANQREKLDCLLTLELTEEKRRVLTHVIQKMNADCVRKAVDYPDAAFNYYELVTQKINAANTIKELLDLSEHFAGYKPE